MKQAPNHPEAELRLLAAALQSNDTFLDLTVAIPGSEIFYTATHGLVWEAFKKAFDSSGIVDLSAVRTTLRTDGFLDRCTKVLDTLESHSFVPVYSDALSAVLGAYKLRRVFAVASEIAQNALDHPADADKFLEEVESRIFALGENNLSESFRSAEQVTPDAIDHLERLATLGDSLIGTPTGFLDLDRLTNGLQEGWLVTLGARPGQGKTSWASSVALSAAEQGQNVVFFSLEMSHLEISMRMISSIAQVDSNRFKNGHLTALEWQRLADAVEVYASLPLWIDDGDCTSSEIEAKVRRFKARHGDIGLVIVDYMQIMPDVDANNEVASIGKISRKFKMLAKSAGCPLLLLSQLNRRLENRPDKRPNLADLRSSGSLEQDSVMVLFLYRESYYNPGDVGKRGTAELIIGKNRFGPTGTFELAFIEPTSTFANLDTFI